MVDPMPDCGWYAPDTGTIPAPPPGEAPLAVVSFYRSYLTSGDTGPIDALIAALNTRGFRACGLFAPSLKGTAAPWIHTELAREQPVVIVNATAFSARDDSGSSP
jgi:cobaltochelatase CobN